MTSWPTKPFACAPVLLGPSPNEPGLVGYWNRMPIGQNLIDGLGVANLTKQGAAGNAWGRAGMFMEGWQFDGSTGYYRAAVADYRSADSLGTISCWVWPGAIGTAKYIVTSADEATDDRYLGVQIDTTNQVRIVQRNADVSDSVQSTGVLPSSMWSHIVAISTGTAYQIYLNGVLQVLIIAGGADTGDWFADTANRDNLVIGNLRRSTVITGPFNGNIADVEIYNVVKDATWVLEKYKQGARAIQGKTDWGAPISTANRVAGFLENTPFQIASGTWKIDTSTLNGKSIKTIKCVAAGSLYLALDDLFGTSLTEQAYGTWDFWVNYGGNGATYVGFLSADTTLAGNGYSIFNAVGGNFGLYNHTGAANLFTTLALLGGAWTRVRVTRRYDGQFTVYWGTAGTPLTLIAALTGSNPVTENTTTSAPYLVLKFQQDDQFAYADLTGSYCFSKSLGVVAP